MSLQRGLIIGSMLAIASISQAQSDLGTIKRILAEGKNNSQVMDHLDYLSNNIGHRLTASPNLDRAYAWTVEKFKEFGCVNVHLEEWGEWPVGFHRGPSSGMMTAPFAHTFEFTSSSWSQGTNGPAKGAAIAAPTTMADFNKMKSQFDGKWVVYREMPPRAPRGRQGEAPPEPTPQVKESMAIEAALLGTKMLGRVLPSRNELVITSGNYRINSATDHPMDVTVTVRKSDMELVFRQLDANNPVELEFNLNQRFIQGPIKNYNVIAEIKGTEKPDEVVIFGGHIDTWDGPGSQGAADNGTGVSTALEAARILNKVGAKPKRTIRFILFSGEEQGLFGSRAYVDMHKEEMDKISCIFIEDGGANYEGGTYALESMIPMFDELMKHMNETFPDMPVKMRTVATMPRGGGSDHVPFNAVGVPGFFWDETGVFDYGLIHHTQHDAFALVPPAYMIQSATNSALACYSMACAPTMMPRAPKPDSGGSSSTATADDDHDHRN